MDSLLTIPEPTKPTRPDDEAPAAQHPLSTSGSGRPTFTHTSSNESSQELQDQNPQMIWMLILAGVALALRLCIWFLGNTQSQAFTTLAQSGKQVLAGDLTAAHNTGPLYPLFTWSAHTLGLSSGLLTALQLALASLAAPAAYIIAKRLTHREFAAITAGLIIALHPAIMMSAGILDPAGLALTFILLAWAVACTKSIHTSGRFLSGLLLALGALTAPLVWIASIGLSLWIFLAKPCKSHAITSLVLLTLGFGPVIAWWSWTGGPTLQGTSFSNVPLLSSTSIQALGEHLNFELHANGPITQKLAHISPDDVQANDPIANILGDSWLILNLSLLLVPLITLPILAVRRQWAFFSTALVMVLLSISFGVLETQSAQLPLIGLLTLLACGIFCTQATPRWTAEELETRQAEKLVKAQIKAEAKLQKRQIKNNIYAFDKPTRKAPPAPPVPPTALEVTSDSNKPQESVKVKKSKKAAKAKPHQIPTPSFTPPVPPTPADEVIPVPVDDDVISAPASASATDLALDPPPAADSPSQEAVQPIAILDIEAETDTPAPSMRPL